MMINWIVAGIFLVMAVFKLRGLFTPTQQQHEEHERRYGIDEGLRGLSIIQRILDLIATLLLGLGFAVAAWERSRGAAITEQIDLQLSFLLSAVICYAVSLGLLMYLRQKTPQSAGQQSPQQLLSQLSYRTISPDEITSAADHRLPALNAGLEALGFRALGPVEVRAALDTGTEVEVTELFASPDGSTFAEPERFFNANALAFRTLFDDGTIIETTLLRTDGGVSQRGVEKMWPRKHLPRAGYRLELRSTGSTHEVWEIHRRHVNEHTAASGHAPLVHRAPELYFQLSRQGLALSLDRRAAELILAGIGVLVIVMGTMLLPLALKWLSMPAAHPYVSIAICLALLLLATHGRLLRLLSRAQLRTFGRLMGG